MKSLSEMIDGIEPDQWASEYRNFLKLKLVAIELAKACELTVKHYEHPNHDNNWALYLTQNHMGALTRAKEILGDK